MAAAASMDLFDQVDVKVDGAMDWQDTARSIARLWAVELAKGPFRKLRKNIRMESNAEVQTMPGLAIPSATLEQIQGITLANQPSLKLVLLRDLVDLEPEREALRIALYDESMRQSDFDQAASVALVAAGTFQTDQDWHVRAAHALVLAGRPAEAKAQADISGPEQMAKPAHAVVLGDIALANGDYREAVSRYSRSMSIRPTPEALVGRAVASALLGDTASSEADMALLLDAPGTRALEGYRLALKHLQFAVLNLGTALGRVIPAIRVHRGSPEVMARTQTIAFRAAALAKLVTKLPNVGGHKRSQRDLDLACKLLDQASQETLVFAQSGLEEQGTEAGLSLGEAINAYRESVARFQEELNPGG